MASLAQAVGLKKFPGITGAAKEQSQLALKLGMGLRVRVSGLVFRAYSAQNPKL